MENIMITATNASKTFFYDLELPANVAVGQLETDVVEAISAYDPALFLNSGAAGLYCNRMGRRLTRDETLESAGVWNGDYLTLLGV